MTTLKPTGKILSRRQAEELAQTHPGVTELDLSEADVLGGSAMHQLVCSFPDAQFTGMDDWTRQEYDWVMKAIEDLAPEDVLFLRFAAEDDGAVVFDTTHNPRRNRALIMTGHGLVTSGAFEHKGGAWLRFKVTRLGLNVLKKNGALGSLKKALYRMGDSAIWKDVDQLVKIVVVMRDHDFNYSYIVEWHDQHGRYGSTRVDEGQLAQVLDLGPLLG